MTSQEQSHETLIKGYELDENTCELKWNGTISPNSGNVRAKCTSNGDMYFYFPKHGKIYVFQSQKKITDAYQMAVFVAKSAISIPKKVNAIIIKQMLEPQVLTVKIPQGHRKDDLINFSPECNVFFMEDVDYYYFEDPESLSSPVIKINDPGTTRLQREHRISNNRIIAFTPDKGDDIVVACKDVHVEYSYTLSYHGKCMAILSYTIDERGECLHIWDVANRQEIACLPNLNPKSTVCSFCVSDDGKIAWISWVDGRIGKIDTLSNKCTFNDIWIQSVGGMKCSSDGSVMVGWMSFTPNNGPWKNYLMTFDGAVSKFKQFDYTGRRKMPLNASCSFMIFDYKQVIDMKTLEIVMEFDSGKKTSFMSFSRNDEIMCICNGKVSFHKIEKKDEKIKV